MLKKLKERLSKKKIITIGIAIIAIITTIVSIMFNQTETQSKKKRASADSELARAMTYDQFADGDENVEGTNINSSYDETTRKFTATRTTNKNDDGTLDDNGYDGTYYEIAAGIRGKRGNG